MIRVYNTLSGQKEDFVPLGDPVRMYVCGVTPYAPSHLGHAMSYIIFDTMRRYLEFSGLNVRYVQNFTDIDDKIIARANELGVAPHQLAEEYISQYFEDMDALNVKRADVYPRATEEIPKIIEMVEGLVARAHAYQTDGDVYFRVRSGPDYGKLSHRNLDDMMAGARVEVGEAKEHPLDFALWKAAKPGEPQWDSPWGPGRPGWHIECSAMSLKYLGETLDIHGGGQDLIFPHHENEIAQSESFTSVTPFVRYWIHNGFMQLGEDKMSKSTGKLITVKQALDEYGADALRLWVISSHYRRPITYSDEVLEATQKGVERLVGAAYAEADDSAAHAIDPAPYRQRFIEAMDDDFGTPQAVAVLFELAREVNRGHDEKLHTAEAQRTLRELADVLGLPLRWEPKALAVSFDALAAVARKHGLTPPEQGGAERLVALLVEERAKLRRDKQWNLADGIRSDLGQLGITLEDRPGETMIVYGKP